VATSAAVLNIEIAGRRWRTTGRAHDLSIALAFNGVQPSFFGAAQATASPIATGGFVGDVRRGGSCNCATYSLTPHCNGTHTECIGHVVEERVSVRDVAREHLHPALLVSIAPVEQSATHEVSDPRPRAGDRLITQASLQASVGKQALTSFSALVVRTLPNPPSKRYTDYDAGEAPPYFTADAMRWIVDHGVRCLVVDAPSIDRANDEGRLNCHRIFWGLPAGGKSVSAASRADAVITELAYIDSEIADGVYLLNLQVAPFVADAAPSRPILLPLEPHEQA
jgi:kynurenine formamidase